MKNLKKATGLFFLTMAVCVLTLASCEKDEVKKTLTFTPAKVEVEAGKTATITVSGGTEPYTVVASDAATATAKAEKSVITVTGVKKGTATIAVTDKNKTTGSVSVTVK